MKGQVNINIEFSSFIGKLFRTHFGKGPESVFVTFNKSVIAIYFGNFLTPLEKALLNQDEMLTVYKTREIIMNMLIPEMKIQLEIMTGLKIAEFYYDWNLLNKSGLILGVFSNIDNLKKSEGWSYPGKIQVEEKIGLLSEEAQKRPLEISSFLLNSRLLLIKRAGVLTMIEKEIIKDGYSDLMRWKKKKLEKDLLNNDAYLLESYLGNKISDMFVDWNFTKDESLITLILQPKRKSI
ncbi:DUF2294 domain-containing protein [Bacillus sp. M6-12]|uniref:DUF2294 domain-containing protein n=1 Tax=Bacillus sp. M6-12 TaxID=2054166 RepID=UPI001156D9B1|nr:Na-translocating system protein MpsC family protein [Bacillus sp. M6-12]